MSGGIGPIRRALTLDELTAQTSRLRWAADARQLLTSAVTTLYDTLLADHGLSLDTLPAGQRLDPRTVQIPARQWEAIAAAVTARAAEWGTGPELALELINVMPGTYDDPAAPLPDQPAADYRPGLLEVHLTRDAVDVIAAATAHVQALATSYGQVSEVCAQAAGSWLVALSQLLSMAFGADTRVHRDGHLSLLVHTSGGLTYGLIFHGATRRCTAGDGCTAAIADDSTVHPLHPAAAVAEHRHRPSFPLDAPRPGTWSFHS